MAVDRLGRSPNRPEPKRDRCEISRNRPPTQTPQAGRQDRSAASCDDRGRRNPVVCPSIHPKPSKVMESEMRENHQVFRRVQLFNPVPHFALPLDASRRAEARAFARSAMQGRRSLGQRSPENKERHRCCSHYVGFFLWPHRRQLTAPAPNVVSLMDALKRSLTEEGTTTEEPAAKANKRKKRAAGQREMLLPICRQGHRERESEKGCAARSSSAESRLTAESAPVGPSLQVQSSRRADAPAC